MSSLVRTIQRSAERRIQYLGRGSRLGITNPTAKDKLAREARENKRERQEM